MESPLFLRGFVKRLEALANIVMVVVGAVAMIVLIRNEITPVPQKSPRIKVGDRVAMTGMNWATNRATRVIVLQTRCRFCADSAAFYVKAATALENRDVHLTAVFPEPVAEARVYLGRMKIPISDVRQVELSTLRVYGTPTVILVDRNGHVAKTWLGRLEPELEEEVLSAALSLSVSIQEAVQSKQIGVPYRE